MNSALNRSLLGQNRVSVAPRLPFDCTLRAAKDPKMSHPRELILLLHGFAESGERFLKKLEPALTELLQQGALVMAPNAPFPMPHKNERGYGVTFSWYFYEPGADEYFIDMETAVSFLTQGIEAHGFATLPKRIIGFSQGGFLAPIVAARLTQVRQLISIGCETLMDEIPGNIPSSISYRLDAIHGIQDEAVPLEKAQKSHERFLASGVPGSLTLLQGSTHRIDDAVRGAVVSALGLIQD